MIAGRLEIELSAGLAGLSSDMQQAKGVVSGAMADMSRAVSAFRSVLGALGVGVSFGAIVAMAKHTLEMADNLGKMAQKTGIATEELSKLRYAASVNDVEIEALGKGIKKLSGVMVEAGDATSKSGILMKTLGVDIRGGINPAIEKIADTFKALPDGATKATLAVELFGKEGMGMIPMLNQGAAGIRALKEEALRLGLVISEDMAKASEKFNDSLKTMKFQSEAAAATFLGSMLPGLNRITAAMIEAKKNSGTLMAVWVAMGGLASEALGLNDSDAEKRATALRDLHNEALKLNEMLQKVDGVPFDKLPVSLRVVKSRLDEVNTAVRVMQALMDAEAGKFDDQAARAARQGRNNGPAPKVDEDAIRRALTAAEAVKKEQAAYEALNKAAGEQKAILIAELEQRAKLSEAEKAAIKIMADLNDGSVKLTAAHRKEIEAKLLHNVVLAKELKLREDLLLMYKNMAEGLEIEAAKQNQMNEALAHFNESLSTTLKDLEFETSLLGKSDTERRIAVDLRRLHNEYVKASNGLGKDELETLTLLYEQQKKAVPQAIAMQEAVRSQVSVWTQLGDAMGGFLNAMTHGFKSGVDYVMQLLKQLLAQMILIFATKWILNLGASLTSGGTSAALTSAAGQVGANTLAGQIGSSVVSYLGRTALGSYLGIGGAAGGASVGAGVTTGAGGTTAASSSASGWMGAVGWAAVIAAAMAYNDHLFRSGWRQDNQDTRQNLYGGGANAFSDRIFRGLGMSDRLASVLSGSSVTARLFGHQARQYDAFGVSGNVSGAQGMTAQNWGDWTEKGGWFRGDRHGTLSPEDAKLDPAQTEYFHNVMQGIAQTVGAFAANMGIDAGAILASYSHDFKLDFKGKTEDEINAMMSGMFGTIFQEQVSQLLSGSGHDALSQWVDQLSGTTDDIANSIMELLGVMEGVKHLDLHNFTAESVLAMAQGGESIGQTFTRIANTMTEFDDAFMSEAQKMDRARSIVVAAFAGLGVAVPDSAEAFYNLVHGIDLSTTAGQQMWTVLMGVAPAFLTVTDAASSAVATFYSLASTLSSAFGSSYARMNLDAAIGTWRAKSGTPSDFDVEGYLRQMIQQGSFAQHLPFIQSLGSDALPAFNELLAAYQAWQKSMEQTSGSLPTFTSGIDDLGNAAQDAARRLEEAKQGLRGYLDSLLINDQLSPLSPTGRLDAARSQFDDLMRLAQSGDANAMGALPGASDAYLRIAREIFASGSAYVNIFNQVAGQLAGVSGYAGFNSGGAGGIGGWTMKFEQALPTSSPLASQGDIRELLHALQQSLAGVAAANDAVVMDQTASLKAARGGDNPARR